MQHFAALQRPSRQRTRSLRESQYRVPRKRAHHDDEDLDDEDDETDGSRDQTQRPADLLPEDAVAAPSAPYPHGPGRPAKESLNHAQVQRSLAAQNPPLFAVDATSKRGPVGRKSGQTSALRQTHLEVLTTIMHQCLLKGDYHRAGRAWGMILRTPIAGIPFDPRFRGRWGISAELLLQRGSSDIAQSPNHGEPPANGHAGYYSEGAFELAREYYERLIIQYPHRKGQTHVTDALTFYPAMFSLWLYEICEQGKLARKQLEQRRSATPDSVFGDDFDRTRFEASRIDAEELLRARELAERLDQLVASPPLDSQGPLLRLRGMVALWVADLILKGDVPTNEGRYEDEEDSEIDVKSTEERLNIFLESRREFERALEFFDKAHNHGETLIETVGSVDLKVRDLSRRIAKLGG